MQQNSEDRIERFLGQYRQADAARRGVVLQLPSMVKRPVSFAGLPPLVRREMYSALLPGTIRVD